VRCVGIPYIESEASAPVSVERYTVELDPLPAYKVQGEWVSFTGRVLRDTEPVPTTRVEIYRAGTLVAAGYTDPDGRFSIPWRVEYGLGCRTHSFVAYHPDSGTYSAGRSMAIAYKTRITLTVPEKVEPGKPFEVSGKLEYEATAPGDWKPLGGKIVSIYYNNIKVAEVTTEADGSFRASVTIPTPGTYTIRATFAGEGVAAAPALAAIPVTAEGVAEVILPILGAAAIPAIVLAIVAISEARKYKVF